MKKHIMRKTVFILSLIFILSAMVFAESDTVSLSFSIGNIPASLNISISPQNPNPGSVTFEGNATYYDPEGFRGNVSLSWYLNSNFLASGGTFTNVSSGETVNAIPVSLNVNSGDRVMLCGDAYDGVTITSNCKEVIVGGSEHNNCKIYLDALASCTGGNITINIRNNEHKSFNLRVRNPDGSIDNLGSIDGNKDTAYYKAFMPGSYYFFGYADDCEVEGDNTNVEDLQINVALPICSFYKKHGLVSSTNNVTHIFANLFGNAIPATIKITWQNGNITASQEFFSQDANFIPPLLTRYNVTVNTSQGCIASTSFIPNLCYTNETEIERNESAVEIQIGNRRYYLFLYPIEKKNYCSIDECNVTADCCQGFCFKHKCITKIKENKPVITKHVDICKGVDILSCYASYILAFLTALIAVYIKYRQDKKTKHDYLIYSLILLIPILTSYLIEPRLGVVLGALEVALVYYLKK